MLRKLAIKRLTASDLTLFEWHFRNRTAGNQKAINLNADVFIDQLYPALPELAAEKGGKVPLDLFIYGPGLAGEHNLQRKIVKFGAYKNWRLNGEYIADPAEFPERFQSLNPGDYAIFDFEGAAVPTSARMVLIAKSLPDDLSLHHAISDVVGINKMRTISSSVLADIIERSGVADGHPIGDLVEEAALEDASQDGIEGTRRLLGRRRGRKLTRDELLKARRSADEVGMRGEELLNVYFEQLKDAGQITDFKWISKSNAVSPYDFHVTYASDNAARLVLDAKSTLGEFERTIHISMNELLHMADGAERYDIYRLYAVGDVSAKLRVAPNVRNVATDILNALKALPKGVFADGISLSPSMLKFGSEITITLPEEPSVNVESGEVVG